MISLGNGWFLFITLFKINYNYKPLKGIISIPMGFQDMGMGMLDFMVSLADRYG